MDRTALTITAVLGVAAEIATGGLTVTGGAEYIEFGIAMVLFAAILVGSYLYVITPSRAARGAQQRVDDPREPSRRAGVLRGSGPSRATISPRGRRKAG